MSNTVGRFRRCAGLLFVSWAVLSCSTTREVKHTAPKQGAEREDFLEKFARGYVPGRSGQVFVVLEPGSFLLSRADSVFYRFMHGSPWDYDVRIPLLLYGDPFVRRGSYSTQATLQDVAPTVLTLLKTAVPTTMTGRVLTEALARTEERPAAVMILVLDGMGLAIWQRFEANLPTLSQLHHDAAWFENTKLNYLPSVTSTGHATVATGTDPRFHGIQANATFDRRTGKADAPFAGMNPAEYRVATLADLWGLETSGRAKILAIGATPRATIALAGHGACTPNGQKIVVAMFDEKSAGWTTNESCFRLPQYLVEASALGLWKDSAASWMGHKVDSGATLLRSGLFPSFEIDALLKMIGGESVGKDAIPDLLLVNLKTPDYVSHQYGPTSRETEEALHVVDAELGRLLRGLNELVGAGRFVVVVTADHGMPIESTKPNEGHQYVQDIVAMVHQRFDPESKLLLNFEEANCQIYVDRERLEHLNLGMSDVAGFVENLPFIRFAFTEEEVRAARVH